MWNQESPGLHSTASRLRLQYPLEDYSESLVEMEGLSSDEVVSRLRRGSVGFARWVCTSSVLHALLPMWGGREPGPPCIPARPPSPRTPLPSHPAAARRSTGE